MENKIVLSPKKILNKQFQIDFKGYKASEVDHFLDLVASDYSAFATMLNQSYEEIESLTNEVNALKQQIQQLQATRSEPRMTESNLNSNVDLLRRLSQLEKEVYNKKD